MFCIQFSYGFVPLMVILSVVTGILYHIETNAITDVIKTDDANKVRLSLKVIKSQLRLFGADALYLADQQNLRNWITHRDPAEKMEARAEMRSFMARHLHYDQLRYLDSDGHEIIRINNRDGQTFIVPDDRLQDKSGRYYVNAIKNIDHDQIYVSPFDLNVEHGKIEEPHKPTIRVGTPIRDREGQFKGSIVLNYLGAQLLNELRGLNAGNNLEVWLLNSRGYWLLGPSAENEWGFMWQDRENRRFQSTYPAIWNVMTSGHQRSVISNTRGLFTYASINTTDFLPSINNRIWYVIAFTPQSYIDTQADTIARHLGLLYALYTGLIILFSWLLARKEVARKRSEDLLRDREKQYRSLLEGAPDAIVIVNKRGEIRLVNSKANHVFGYSRDELIGCPVETLLPERFHNRHKAHRQGYIERPAVRPMGESQELFARRRDGSELPVEISLSPLIRDSETLVTAIIRDVSARKSRDRQIKELNRNLVARTTELETINKELEAFSYSVSHDLRAPLRAVNGFSRTLLKDYGDDQLDPRGRDRLERVRAAAQRMGRLIDDLLTLSRISRTDVNRETVDITELATKIVNELQQAESERHVECVIQPALFAHADAHLLSAAMTNLLSNAWKFTSRIDRAHIEVRGDQSNGEYLYIVEDNGAGFNMAYADKLFGAFQRLHDTSDFPGTGIGLATVQRVIHKHGGRIWAEAEEGKGARFYFTLGSVNP
jgi:PAS domain S-box-containing protein